MAVVIDKAGLERSVLSYVDISCQRPGKFYLIIDEPFGKAMFTVDAVDVREYEIVATRNATNFGLVPEEVVIRFSPQLTWRMVNTTDVYIQSSRDVLTRDGQDTKEVRDFRSSLIKELGLEAQGVGGGPLPEGIGLAGPGQYL